MKASHRVVSNTGILYARMMFTVFLSLYTTRILLDSLGSEDFGIFAVVGGVIAMLGFLNASMSAASQRFMSYAHGQGDEHQQVKIFNVSCVIHIFVGICMIVFLEIAGLFLFDGFLNIPPERIETAKLVYHFVVISTFFTILSVPYDAVITARENMLFFAGLSIIESVIKLVIALYISNVSSDKLLVYGGLTAILMLFLFILKGAVCHRLYSECVFEPKNNYEKSLFKEMSSFGGWSLLGNATGMFATYGQNIVLNKFFGTQVNAAQGVASQLAGQVTAFSVNMLKALSPHIIKSEGAGRKESMIRSTMLGCKYSYLLSFMFMGPFLIETQYLLSLWLGEVPDYTSEFCILILINLAIIQLFQPLSVAISATGKIKQVQVATSCFALAPLIISSAFFLEGAGPVVMYKIIVIYALLRSFFIIFPFAIKQCSIPAKRFFKEVLYPILLITVIPLLSNVYVLSILEEGLFRLSLVCAIHIFLFVLSTFLFGMNRDEKKVTLNILKKIAGRARDTSRRII